MDTDFRPPRSDMLATVVATIAVVSGLGCIGIALWVAVVELRQRRRWWRIGR